MISSLEHQLLLGLLIVTMFFAAIRSADFAMADYNRAVAEVELEKGRKSVRLVEFTGCGAAR